MILLVNSPQISLRKSKRVRRNMKKSKVSSLQGLDAVHQHVLTGGGIEQLFIADLIIGDNVRSEIKIDDEEFMGLKASIMQKGILQPVTVSESKAERGKYSLIAGFRRITAYAALVEEGKVEDGKIPVHIISVSDEVDYAAVQLIENIQREDLDIFDKGIGFQKLYALSGDKSEPQEILSKLLIDYKNNAENEVITYFVKTGLVPSIRSVITAYQAICLPSSIVELLRGRKEFHVSLIGVLYDNRGLEVMPRLVQDYVSSGFNREQLLKSISVARKKPKKTAEHKKQVSFVAHIDKLIKSANSIVLTATDENVRIKKKPEALERIAELRTILDEAERLLNT